MPHRRSVSLSLAVILGCGPAAGGLTMRLRRNQMTIAAVTFLLGILVIVQLRTQAGMPHAHAVASDGIEVAAALRRQQPPAFIAITPTPITANQCCRAA